ncbi:MAG: heat-inducible transcriptional repressor HrcA [Candidatus Cloacimonetes bacterium]|nr:heat-inducible transcriptional repressor HrcA [Candidatus Cloacimonadota bacterium]
MKKNEIRELKALTHLIEEYIESNEPVSSRLLCEKYLPEVSPATIRIDLHKLEQKRFIFQPHTSAGRIPTLAGYRYYINGLDKKLAKLPYDKEDLLRRVLISNYRDTVSALHYIMQILAKETDQLSFIAEPEIAYGVLENLEVFKIGSNKLLFVVSLDSGVDKTVIINCGYEISEQQLKALVRYVNESLSGLRIHDIQHKYIEEMADKMGEVNFIFSRFLQEFQRALTEMSSYYIHFEASISFLNQPEFNTKEEILSFLGLTQRQDLLVNMMHRKIGDKPFEVLLGEDLGRKEWFNYVIVFSRYELFGIPGYLGIIAPVRMNYQKNIPIIRDMAKIITEVTKKGMIVPKFNEFHKEKIYEQKEKRNTRKPRSTKSKK